MLEIVVECSECSKLWRLPQGSPGIYCVCHLVCPDGDKPQDCNMTQQNYSGKLGWPVGMHLKHNNEGDDILHRTYYCSVHKKYSYKTPVWIEADWQQWRSRRAPEHMRLHKGNV